LAGFEVRRESFVRLVFAFELRDSNAYERTVDRVSGHLEEEPRVTWADRPLRRGLVLPHLWRHMNTGDFSDGDDERARDELAREIAHWWEAPTVGAKGSPPPIPEKWDFRVDGPSSPPIQFRIKSLELVLFRAGVGFLIFELAPLSQDFDAWLNFTHHIRYFDVRELENALPSDSFRQLRPDLLRLVTLPRHEHGASYRGKMDIDNLSFDRPRGMGFIADWILDDALGPEAFQVTHGPGRTFVYSFLSVKSQRGSTEAQHFEARYRWRRFLRSDTAVFASDDDDLTSRLRGFGDGVTFSYSIDGGGVFAVDVPQVGFFTTTLPDDVRRPYFFGALLAYHQRLALLRFSSLIASIRLRDTNWLDGVEEVFDRYLEYLTSSSFAHIMHSGAHDANHREWMATFGVSALQKEVESEVRRLRERAAIEEARAADQFRKEEKARDLSTSERAARTDRRFSVFALAFAIPSLVLAVIGVAYPDGINVWVAWGILAALIVVGLATGNVLSKWSARLETLRDLDRHESSSAP